MVTGEGHHHSFDWWTLGVLLFEMVCGFPPFHARNREKMFENIRTKDPQFPKQLSISKEC